MVLYTAKGTADGIKVKSLVLGEIILDDLWTLNLITQVLKRGDLAPG